MHKFHHASRCTSFCACEEASSLTLCIGFDWRVVVLGFGGYFDLASLGLLDFQICFFVVFFFCFLFWFSIWVHGGLFGSLIWIVGCFIEWLVAIFWMVGGVLVAGFSSLHGVLGGGWWWFVQLCLHLVGWELCKIFPFTVKQTLKNDFHCIFKLATKHGIMKIFY